MKRACWILSATLVMLAAQASGQSFTSLSGPYGGDVTDLERDGSGNTYAIVSSALYKSSNNGDNWQRIAVVTPSSGFIIYDLITSGTKLYAVYFNAFYVSTDGGLNWTKPASTFPFTGARRLLKFGPDGFIAVCGSDGIYVTKDEGVTWTKALSDNVYIYTNERTVANSAGDLYTISRATANTTSFLLKKLAYPGAAGAFVEANWQTKYTSAINNTNAHLMASTTTNDLYLSISNDLLVSQDGGTTWPSMKGNITQTSYSGVGGVASDGKVYFVNSSFLEIYSCTTPGTSPTWTISPLTGVTDFGASVSSLAFISPTSIMFGANQGAGAFRSTDSGVTLVHKSVGMTGSQGRGIEVTNGRIIYLAGSSSRGYWTSSDNGVTWIFAALPNYYSKVKKMSNGSIVLYGSNYVAYSTDNGSTFTQVSQANTDVVEGSGGTLYAGSGIGAFSTSATFGASWSTFTVTGWPAGYIVQRISSDVNNLYVSASSGSTYKLFSIVRSTGAVTELTGFPSTSSLNNLFVANNKIYASQSTLYYFSTDQGVNWTLVGFSGSAVFPLSDGVTTAICVGRSGSFYITQDDGLTWNSILMPASNSYATGISLDPASTPANPVYYLSATSSPCLKYTGKLIVDPATLPEYINFNWQPVAGPYGGAPTDLELHPDGSMYALVGQQIHRYAGGIWTRLNPISSTLNSIFDLEIDGTGNIYALLSSGSFTTPRIYVSTNGGTSWTSRSPAVFNISTTYYVGIRLEKMNDGSLVVCATTGRIFRSVDDGNNFVAVKSSAGNTFSSIQPIYKTSSFAAAVNSLDGVLISPDNGQSWVARNNGLVQVNSLYQFFNLSVSTTGEMLISMYTALGANNSLTNAEVFRSTNQGLNWQLVPTPNSGSFGKRIMVMPNGDYILSINSTLELFKSSNQGVTWTPLPSQGDIFSYYEVSGADVYIRSGFNGIFRSSDNGTTLLPVSNGLPRPSGFAQNPSSDIKLIDNQELIVASAGLFHSSDLGQSWTRPNNYLANRFLVKGDSVIAYGGRYNLLSTDNGHNWSILGSDRYFGAIVTANHTAYYAMSSFAIEGIFGLYYSTDLVTWIPVPVVGLPTTLTFSFLSAALDQNGVLHAVIQEGAATSYYRVAFEIATKVTEPITPVNPQSVFYDNGKIYIYDAIGAIYETDDSGATWTTTSAPAGGPMSITNGYFFIGGSNTVLWLSRNGGTSWQSVGESTIPSTNFLNVIVNEYDGFAYAILSNSVVKKSQVVVMTDDATDPINTAFSPANNSSGALVNPSLRITFNEAAVKVTGKKLRIFDLASPGVSLETIDLSTAVQDGKDFTVTPTITLGYLKTYFVTIDVGGFTDIFGNTYAGINNSTTWRFTTQEVPDTQAPVITFTPDALQKGSDKVFEVTITDNIGVLLPRVFYRSITTTNPETTANLAFNASTGKYNATVSSGAFGLMGLEYYFTATDAAGNIARSPASGYHYSFIFFTSAFNQTIPGGLVGSGGTLSSWRIISNPYTLSDPNVATVFSELGAADVSKWRLITLATQTSWAEYPQNFSSFVQGKGYFINVKDLPSSGLIVEGATTPSNNKTSPFALTLVAGWTQIGNPYPFPIKWSEVLAANGNPGSIATTLKLYTGSYVDDSDDRLEVFEGAFVLNSGSSPVTLNIPVVGSLTGGRKGASSTGEAGSWLVPINARSGDLVNTFGGVGMHPDATVGVDNHDDFNPPPLEDYIQLSFPHPEHFLKSSTRDVVPVGPEFQWEFEVQSSFASEATLEWDLTHFANSGNELYLLDLGTQRLVDMTATQHYQVNTSHTNRLRIYYGNNLLEKIKPTMYWLGEAYPNPATTLVTIPFVLPETGQDHFVRMEVYDLMGRRTATLANGSYPAGFYQAKWNIEREAVACGVYLYRLIVNEDKNIVFTGKVLVKN